MRRLWIPAALCAGVWAGSAGARPDYPNRVPTPYSCETCHLDPNDRLNRNGFGIDFALERGLWVNGARGLCWLDSDFDGLTNGEELNDPSCLWAPGAGLPGGRTTHPGDGRDPDTCGDGVTIPFAEECDVTVPDDVSCQSMGYDEGELGCTADCYLDVRDCRRLPPPDMAPPPEPEDMGPPDAGPDAGLDEGPIDRDEGPGEPDPEPSPEPEPEPGADAEQPGPDAAPGEPVDAAITADAGSDAGDEPDVIGIDPLPDEDPGCSAAPGAPTGGPWLSLLAGLALVGLRRRRIGRA